MTFWCADCGRPCDEKSHVEDHYGEQIPRGHYREHYQVSDCCGADLLETDPALEDAT